MTIALLLLQALTLGIGEHRTEDTWRSASNRWDVAELVAESPEVARVHVAGTMSFRHGWDWDYYPAWGIGAFGRIATPGPLGFWVGGQAFTDSRPRMGLVTKARLNRWLGLHFAALWARDLACTARIDLNWRKGVGANGERYD